MNPRKGTVSRVGKRNAEIYRLSLLGYSAEEIAALFTIKPTAVAPIVREARRQTEADIRDLMAFEGIHKALALTDYVQSEAVRAWERSKKPKTRKSASKEKGGSEKTGSSEKDKVSTATEERDGDRGYLELALKASEDMRRLLGVDAPTVQRYLLTIDSKPDEGSDALTEAKALTPGDLARVYRETISASPKTS